MTPSELEAYLHKHIPLSRAMAVSAASIDGNEVILRAPLAPNINHRETVFGGSASALAILASWSLVHVRLRTARIAARLVIQRNTTEYEAPIAGAFVARARVEDAQWQRFETTLMRKDKARITVQSVLEFDNRQVGRFVGEFVALDRRRDARCA